MTPEKTEKKFLQKEIDKAVERRKAIAKSGIREIFALNYAQLTSREYLDNHPEAEGERFAIMPLCEVFEKALGRKLTSEESGAFFPPNEKFCDECEGKIVNGKCYECGRKPE